jgi:hypothetical protein
MDEFGWGPEFLKINQVGTAPVAPAITKCDSRSVFPSCLGGSGSIRKRSNSR